MAAGIQVDKSSVNNAIGSVSRNLHQAFLQADVLKAYFDATVDADLVSMGFTSGDVSVMKSAFADLAQLATLYRGGATLGAAKDFRTFAKQLHGIGL